MTEERYKKNIGLFYDAVVTGVNEVLSPDKIETSYLVGDNIIYIDTLSFESIDKIIINSLEVLIECKGLYEKEIWSDIFSLNLKFHKDYKFFSIEYLQNGGSKKFSFRDETDKDNHNHNRINHWVCYASTPENTDVTNKINQIKIIRDLKLTKEEYQIKILNKKIEVAIRILANLPEE